MTLFYLFLEYEAQLHCHQMMDILTYSMDAWITDGEEQNFLCKSHPAIRKKLILYMQVFLLHLFAAIDDILDYCCNK